MRAELTKSSISGSIQFLVATLLVFITIPLFVRILGTEAYGVFSLVALVGNLNTFASLGLNSALVRFLAEQGKTVESDQDIIVTFIIQFVILCPLTLCGIFFQRNILISILNIPLHLLNDAGWLFLSMLIGNIFFLLGQTFTAILDSQQKIYLTNLYQMFYNCVYWGLILLVISLGYPLRAVAIAILVSTILWFFIVSISGLRSWGGLSFVGLRSNGIRIAKKQLSYGIQIYLGGLLIFLYEPFSKILVAQFIGVAEVGIFDIGLKVRDQIYRFISKLLYPLFPLISKLTDREKIRNIVHDVEQKIFFVMLPLIAIILLTAKSLVALFFHSNVDAISITIACVLSGYLIGSITVFPIYQYLIIKGHAPKTILIQCINVFTNAIVFLILYNWLGYYAAVIATSVAILTSCGVLIYYQKKYLNSLIFDSIQQIIVIFVTFLVALIFGFFFNSILGSSIWKLVFNPVIIISTTIVFYRRFALINIADISRYFGYNNIFSKVFIYVLCRNKG